MIKMFFEKRCGVVQEPRLLEKLAYKISHISNGSYTIEVKVQKKRRTVPQNALYWMWLSIIAEHTGDDAESLHEAFKRMFLPKSFRMVMGREVEVDITTTTLSTADMAAYMQRLEAFAAQELGMTLPHPGDNEFTEFYEEYLRTHY